MEHSFAHCGLCAIFRDFFFVFLDALSDIHGKFIQKPKNMAELRCITRSYEDDGLPCDKGSLDVISVWWFQCPSGDLNRVKEKETFPSLAFECVTDFNQQIMGVYGPQLGSINNKEIVNLDHAVCDVTSG